MLPLMRACDSCWYLVTASSPTVTKQHSDNTSTTIWKSIGSVLLFMHTSYCLIQYWFDVSKHIKLLNIFSKQKRDQTQMIYHMLWYIVSQNFLYLYHNTNKYIKFWLQRKGQSNMETQAAHDYNKFLSQS